MIDAVGVSLPVVLATPSAKTSLSNSTIQTTSNWLLVLISSSWTATTGPTTVTSSLSFRRQTTATDAVTRQPSWKLTSSWNTPSCNSTQPHIKMNLEILTEEPPTISYEKDHEEPKSGKVASDESSNFSMTIKNTTFLSWSSYFWWYIINVQHYENNYTYYISISLIIIISILNQHIEIYYNIYYKSNLRRLNKTNNFFNNYYYHLVHI